MTAQHPAAPETETDANGLTEAEKTTLRCTIHDTIGRSYGFDAICRQVERIVAERVRVVEGEREQHSLRADMANERAERWKVRRDEQHARAESAEAAHEAEKAALIALADTWERDNEDHLNRFGQHLMGGAVLSCAEHLRDLLAGGGAR